MKISPMCDGEIIRRAGVDNKFIIITSILLFTIIVYLVLLGCGVLK